MAPDREYGKKGGLTTMTSPKGSARKQILDALADATELETIAGKVDTPTLPLVGSINTDITKEEELGYE